MLETPEDRTGTVQARIVTSFAFNTDLQEIYIAYKDMVDPNTPFQENQPWVLRGQEYSNFIIDLNARTAAGGQASIVLIDLCLEALPGGDTGNIVDNP